MPGPATNRTMSVEEIEAYIREVAAEMGIDPETAVAVAKSEGLQEGTWQSNESYKGGRETSYGPYQLFTGGGKGNEFEAQYGKLSQDPENIKQQVRFALSEAMKGGWGPWHGAKRVGIGPRQGLPGGKRGQVAGRRGRAGETGGLAALTQPGAAPSPEGRDAWLQQWQDYYDPKGARTLLGKGFELAGWSDPNERQSTRPKTLGSFLARKTGLSEAPAPDPRYLTGTEKELAKAKAAVDLVNTAAPMSAKDQIAQKQKKKPGTLGQLAITKMFGAPEEPTNIAPKNSSLLGLFGWG